MPYVIVSTVALLSNLYKNAPLIVGDKDSDPELMRFLGARMTTNYPTCGSPPMYVLHAPPRVVFDNLEKRGYCLMSSQTIQEHAVWVLARPRVPEDDHVEIQRGGPNDKASQTAVSDGEDNGRRTSITTNDSIAESTAKKVKSANGVDIESDSERRGCKSVTQRNYSAYYNRGDCQYSSCIEKAIPTPEKNDVNENGTRVKVLTNTHVSLKNVPYFKVYKIPQVTFIHEKEQLEGKPSAKDTAQVSEPVLHLDEFTQTGIGDYLSIPKLPKIEGLDEEVQPNSPVPNTVEAICSFTSFNYSSFEGEEMLFNPATNQKMKLGNVPYSKPASPLLENNPIFADLIDRTHLACLTQCEGCCCEE